MRSAIAATSIYLSNNYHGVKHLSTLMFYACNIVNIAYTRYMPTTKSPMVLLLIRFTPEQIEVIENLWHREKLRNRSEMVRRLVEIGIKELSK